MIAALYSSRSNGSKTFIRDGVTLGWETIERVFREEMGRADMGRSRKVPGLKYAFVYRDNWTRLNVRPAKIMQVHASADTNNNNNIITIIIKLI